MRIFQNKYGCTIGSGTGESLHKARTSQFVFESYHSLGLQIVIGLLAGCEELLYMGIFLLLGYLKYAL